MTTHSNHGGTGQPCIPSCTGWETLRKRTRNGAVVWQFHCPGCGDWGDVDDDQINGRVSIDHTDTGCDFHETRDLSPIAEALR